MLVQVEQKQEKALAHERNILAELDSPHGECWFLHQLQIAKLDNQLRLGNQLTAAWEEKSSISWA